MSLAARSGWALLVSVLITHACLAQENWGHFKGEIVTKFLNDGRNMELQQAFGYVDTRGMHWDVPQGAMTDGASIPELFWIAFPPFTGRYRAAAIVHDYYCQVKTRTWRDTHDVFYTAMRAAGVEELQAKAMYAAVYNFGPRWGIGARTRGPGAEKYRTAEQQRRFFEDVRAWIGRENPTLQQINRQLDAAGEAPR